jgi:hypothetical protein
MGMCADIVAIGPFSQDIIEYLEYPPNSYLSTRPGTPVIIELFGILEGSSQSRAFAKTLGITDPWDFNQHKIDPSKINLPELCELLAHIDIEELYRSEITDSYLSDIRALEKLKSRGFDFYFRPNG